MLHVEDLFDLIVLQCQRNDCWDGRVLNVGGGEEISVSLQELTGLCQSATGKTVPITAVPETHGVDIRIYVTDSSLAQSEFGWKPRRDVSEVVRDIHRWLCDWPDEAKRIFLD